MPRGLRGKSHFFYFARELSHKEEILQILRWHHWEKAPDPPGPSLLGRWQGLWTEKAQATCRIWQAAAHSWLRRLISPALRSRPACMAKAQTGKRLWPAFLFLLTKPSAIRLPWPRARTALRQPACVLPWQWRCAFCQGSSWWMGSDYLPSRFTSSKVQTFLW